MSYSRNKEGKFVKGTAQPHGFERGSKPWNKGLGGRICSICGKEFHKPGRKYCSKECFREMLRRRTRENNPNWKDGISKDREILRQRSRKSMRRKKIELADLLGGKCTLCNYNKYYGALDFHHINPEEKETKNFQGIWNLYKRVGLDEIKKRLVIICANCHREIHEGI